MQDRGKAVRGALTKEQHEAFWNTVVAHYDAAIRTARGKFVRTQDVRDIVHTAAVRLYESYACHPAKLPKTDAARCRALMTTVARHALNSHGPPRPEPPLHACWGEPVVPSPRGRRLGDRSLETIFEVLTTDVALGVPTPYDVEYRAYVEMLAGTLEEAMSRLETELWWAIEASYTLDITRDQAAVALDVSPRTIDSYRQKAYKKLRIILLEMINAGEIPAHSRARTEIEAYEAGYQARGGRRVKAPKDKRIRRQDSHRRRGRKKRR